MIRRRAYLPALMKPSSWTAPSIQAHTPREPLCFGITAKLVYAMDAQHHFIVWPWYLAIQEPHVVSKIYRLQAWHLSIFSAYYAAILVAEQCLKVCQDRREW